MAEKRKRMTQKQKDYNRKLRKEMKEKGILPPDKKRMNRKKFVEETLNEWKEREYSHMWDIYLTEAAFIVSAKTDSRFNTSPESVGAAKVLKIALKLNEFQKKIKSEGRKSYQYQEKLDYLMEVLNA